MASRQLEIELCLGSIAASPYKVTGALSVFIAIAIIGETLAVGFFKDLKPKGDIVITEAKPRL